MKSTSATAGDNIGLDYTVDPVVDTRAGDDTLAMARGNLLQGSSFAFEVMGDEGDEWSNDGGILLRHLLSVRLIDVSPCVGPVAYDSSTVSLRSLAAQVDVPLTDVVDLARAGQLPKLFQRTDNRGPAPKPGPKPGLRSPAERRAELTRMRYPEPPPKTISGRSALLEMMRTPQPRKTMAERKAELTRMALPPYETAASIGAKTLEG